MRIENSIKQGISSQTETTELDYAVFLTSLQNYRI